jgi:hypothetical protein
MKVRAWGPLFALLALLAAGLTGMALQYSEYDEAEPAKTEKRYSPSTETIIQTAPDKGDKKGKEKEAWYKPLFEKPTDSLLILFNALLALFTWLLYDATRKLWKAGDAQLEFLRKSAAYQSRDMQASIAAAAEANRISREGLQATQRAWISEESAIAGDFIWSEKGGEVVIATTIRNIGNIPAQDVWISLRIFPARSLNIDEIITTSKERAAQSGRSQIGQMLFPNGKPHTQNGRLTITREQIEDFYREIAVEPGEKKPIFLNVAVAISYLSAMDRKDSRTIRYYNLQRIPEDSEGISYPLAVNVDESVRQDRLLLTHFWMPSYAD